jgi:hypothetical protein
VAAMAHRAGRRGDCGCAPDWAAGGMPGRIGAVVPPVPGATVAARAGARAAPWALTVAAMAHRAGRRGDCGCAPDWAAGGMPGRIGAVVPPVPGAPVAARAGSRAAPWALTVAARRAGRRGDCGCAPVWAAGGMPCRIGAVVPPVPGATVAARAGARVAPWAATVAARPDGRRGDCGHRHRPCDLCIPGSKQHRCFSSCIVHICILIY